MRILIVDDAATVRFLLTRTLHALGHEVRAASDGREALTLIAEDRPEVVISDWLMPGLDGDELCRRLRADDGSYIYFILLTSLEGRDNVLAGMRAGADDYLTKPFLDDDLEACLIAAERVSALHAELAAKNAELERLNMALFDEARTDALTGVGNRLRMAEELRAFSARHGRYGEAFAVGLFDVDHFKALNDEQGHLTGDVTLRAIAQSLSSRLRPGDAIFRYGGEEFLVIFAGQDAIGAMRAAERLREAVQGSGLPHGSNGQHGVVTVSAGIAHAAPGGYVDLDALLADADRALYLAKARGRNRVEVSTPAARHQAA